MNYNQTDYSKYEVTPKAQDVLRKVVRRHKIDPSKPYDLFLFTSYIQANLVPNQREACRLTTTGEIMRAIKYMVDKNLF